MLKNFIDLIIGVDKYNLNLLTMYNGIGLQTPRGSSTSGHVTKNLCHVNPSLVEKRTQMARGGGLVSNNQAVISDERQPDKEVMDHKRKREIESKLYDLREMLEEKGYDEEEIEERIKNRRKELEASQKLNLSSSSKTDTHVISALKQAENERMKKALRIRDDDHFSKKYKRTAEQDDVKAIEGPLDMDLNKNKAKDSTTKRR